jgi:hypothetical protein
VTGKLGLKLTDLLRPCGGMRCRSAQSAKEGLRCRYRSAEGIRAGRSRHAFRPRAAALAFLFLVLTWKGGNPARDGHTGTGSV